MPAISCFFYRLFYRQPNNFIFIQFENYIKVILNSKSVILTYRELASDKQLYQIFILSLLLTNDTSSISSIISKNKKYYGVLTLKHCKKSCIGDYHEFVQLDKSNTKNPLNAIEPKRRSSNKKVRKFFKFFDYIYENELVKDLIIIYEEFIISEINAALE